MSANAKLDCCVLPLPAELRQCDRRLKAAAARLLQLPTVRSVLVDGDRAAAVVRLHAKCVSDAISVETPHDLLADLPTHAGTDSPLLHPVVFWTDPHSETLCFIKQPAQVHGWRKVLLLAAAGLALVLGLLGVVLPGLPTTPFVLLASVCLLRSSPRLHERLLHSRLFGGVLRDWHLHRGIRPHIRYKALVVIALVVAASLYMAELPPAAMLLVAMLAAYGMFYVWRLPSVVDERPSPVHSSSTR